jgi:hypothetical protein
LDDFFGLPNRNCFANIQDNQFLETEGFCFLVYLQIVLVLFSTLPWLKSCGDSVSTQIWFTKGFSDSGLHYDDTSNFILLVSWRMGWGRRKGRWR